MTPYNKISGDPAPQFLRLRSGNGQKKHFQSNFCGWNLYKKHCWVDIMFSKRHFFQKSLVKWYKLIFAVQISPMSTRREISLAKDLIRHFCGKRHQLGSIFWCLCSYIMEQQIKRAKNRGGGVRKKAETAFFPSPPLLSFSCLASV